MKSSLLIGLWVMAFLTMISCKSTFNEEEFREQQAKLKAVNDSISQLQNLSALDIASRMAEFKVQVMENNSPMEGVAVTITNLSDNTSLQPISTDATGTASFKNQVMIGKNNVNISKTGYATANFEINLGTVEVHKNYEMMASSNTDGTTTPQVIPIPQTGKAIVPIFALGGSTSSAVIKGTATIETDLTNTTPEIPQNVRLRAEFNLSSQQALGFFPSNGNGLTNIVTSYSLVGDSTSGKIDSKTGAFSINVPASAVGLDLPIRLSAPAFTTKQILFVNYVGTSGTPFKNTDVETTFVLGDTAQNIPVVPGAYAVFNSPSTTPGKGFSCDFEGIPRLLDGGLVNGPAITQIGNTSYQLTNPGQYAAVPDITVSGEGTTATAKPQMSFYLNTITVTNVGSGYVPNSTVTINIAYGVQGGNYVANSFDVITTSGGTLPSVISIPDIDGGSAQSPATTDPDYDPLNFNLTVTSDSPPAVPGTVEGTFVAKVIGVKIYPGTTLYSGAPQFTFSGGNATEQAELKVIEFKSQYSITLNNNSITSPYKTMPQDIQFVFPDTPASASATNNNVDYESDGTVTATAQNFLLSLTTDGNSIASALPDVTFRTTTFWSVPPTLLITDDVPQQASATVAFNGNTVSGLTNVSNGNGYDEPITLQINTPEGASGSGATMDISSFVMQNPDTREYTWNGKCAMTNSGSGYVANLNPQKVVNPTPLSELTIHPKPGEVYTVNINFGTGSKRSADIH
jgi:hypothetical protein